MNPVPKTITALILFLVVFLSLTPGALAGERRGALRGRIVDSTSNPMRGVNVQLIERGKPLSAAETGSNGEYSLVATLGRSSFQWRPGFTLFGISTRSRRKFDIRIKEATIRVEMDNRTPFELTVPVYFADLGRYAVYVCDVVVPEDGEPYWNDPEYLSISPVTVQPDVVLEGKVLVFEVSVGVPPHKELSGRLRVVLEGKLFPRGWIKAFDDGTAPDGKSGDGVYTASFKIPETGPFGFFVVQAKVILPELSARFEPGEAWPLLYSTTQTQQAFGRVESVSQVYSLGGVEVGLEAEWYYFWDRYDDLYFHSPGFQSPASEFTLRRWYALFARKQLSETSTSLFVCRGMVELGAARALMRAISWYELGELDLAEKKLSAAMKLAPDYESLPVWDAKIELARGNIAGAIGILEIALENEYAEGLDVVLAELYRSANDREKALDAYSSAYRRTGDAVILRTLAFYLYEIEEYAAAQNAFDALKKYAYSIPYRYSFLLHGGFNFEQRFNRTSHRAEKALFADFAPPSSVWQETLFEEAFIMGSLSGWREVLSEKDRELSSSELKKFAVVLRLAGELDEAMSVAEEIPDAEGSLERGLIALDRALLYLDWDDPPIATDDESVTIVTYKTVSDLELLRAYVELLTPIASANELDVDYSGGWWAALYHNLALVSFVQGSFDAVEVQASIALELDPRHHEARFLLARALEKLGKYEEAIRHWQWFVDDEPEGALKILGSMRLEDLKEAVAEDDENDG